jgi:tRNA(His) 5'-end guanylyltransferase
MKHLKFDFNAIGDQIKTLEDRFEDFLIPGLPIVARFDGNNFHNFTKGLDKPCDEHLMSVMSDLTQWICEEYNAVVGYTQSDEISIIFNNPIGKSESMQTIMFDGRIEKLCSILAAKVSVKFNQLINDLIASDALASAKFHHKMKTVPVFDCRVFSCPSDDLLRNSIVWRQLDCRKNAVSMAAHTHFSHKSLQGKKSEEKIEMLFQKGITFSDYPSQFRNGLFVVKRRMTKSLSQEDLARIPELFRSHVESVERSVYVKYTDVVLQKMETVEEISSFLFDVKYDKNTK